MSEETKEPKEPPKRNRWREGKKPINAWVPADLVERVHRCRRAEQRPLVWFVEQALKARVELVEAFGMPGEGRARKRRG
jgi:hypothetical protein